MKKILLLLLVIFTNSCEENRINIDESKFSDVKKIESIVHNLFNNEKGFVSAFVHKDENNKIVSEFIKEKGELLTTEVIVSAAINVLYHEDNGYSSSDCKGATCYSEECVKRLMQKCLSSGGTVCVTKMNYMKACVTCSNHSLGGGGGYALPL